MSIANETWQQARTIYRTVRMIQERMIRQHASAFKVSGTEPLCAELSFPQFNAVFMVRERDAVTIKELAEALQVSAPSASAMVDRLVDMGMLTREQSQVDRREVVVRVSERGLEHLAILEEQILDAIADLLKKLGAESAAQWTNIYQKISRVIESEQAVSKT
ncbi:MAG: MarR family transcriptional regulator [Candidatus Hydrogenedentes bacterium]|nr:MarR family transcriptional regulator [Candidatus Hydrogenedentota bacterium]